jgi:hypothetical protein
MPNVREDLMMKKYAVDVIAPCVIVDKRTDEFVVIENIERIPNTDLLMFMGYFEADGAPYDRPMDDDSVIRVLDTSESDVVS